MPSNAPQYWNTVSQEARDEIEAAHSAIGGIGRGRRYATGQINQAYVVLLTSQFQLFCRNLHTECAQQLTQPSVNPVLLDITRRLLTQGRKLDVGNPNPGHVGSDFGRFGISLWDHFPSGTGRTLQLKLELLTRTRNAIAHQDFRSGTLNATLTHARTWRRACRQLAINFDRIMYLHLKSITGVAPW